MIRDEMLAAQAKRDMLAIHRAGLAQKRLSVSLGAMALTTFIELADRLGMFFGVKKLFHLPVEQLKLSGVSWVPDLTIADTTWALPIIATVLMNMHISVCHQ